MNTYPPWVLYIITICASCTRTNRGKNRRNSAHRPTSAQVQHHSERTLVDENEPAVLYGRREPAFSIAGLAFQTSAHGYFRRALLRETKSVAHVVHLASRLPAERHLDRAKIRKRLGMRTHSVTCARNELRGVHALVILHVAPFMRK